MGHVDWVSTGHRLGSLDRLAMGETAGAEEVPLVVPPPLEW